MGLKCLYRLYAAGHFSKDLKVKRWVAKDEILARTLVHDGITLLIEINLSMKQVYKIIGAVFLMLCAESPVSFAQNGYIYIHKKTLDENSSINFDFSVTGGPTPVANFALNDQPAQIDLGDIGAAQTGRLWAVGRIDHILYYRNAGSAAWIATGVTNAARVDGGAGSSCYYVTTGGDIWMHDGTTATDIYSGTSAVDVGSGWDNRPYATFADGKIYRYIGGGTTWSLFYGNPKPFANIDVSPADGYIYATCSSSAESYRISPAGSGATMGAPIGNRGSVFYDIAADGLGNVYALISVVTASNGTSRFVHRWVSDTNWSAEEATTNQADRLTGGPAGQLWTTIKLSWDNAGYPYHNIFTRALSGTTNWWIDDERVRTSTVGNSIMIPVAPGTYTITEAAAANWDLQNITIYDPSSNSSMDLNSRTATIVVAANEVVHVIYQNGIVQPFAMANNCGTVYNEDFGTGATGSFGAAFTGQTSYHYIGNSTPAEDGHYKIVSQAFPDFNTWGATGFYDHTTGDGTGRMLAVNAAYDQNEFFRRRFTGIVPGATYNFSAWIANLTPGAPIDPNVSFKVIDPVTRTVLASNTTGNLTGSSTAWRQYTLNFVATTDVIELMLVNNNVGGDGNDLAIDDISFAMVPPTTPVTTIANALCGMPGSITITSPAGAYYEYSKDGTNWQASATFSNLPAGSYTIYAKLAGATGCQATATSVVQEALCVLPLQLVSFSGQAQGQVIKLSWVTSNESDVKQYVIEKSSDGVHFSDMDGVSARNLPGNAYSTTDAHPYPSKNYYRLRSVDIDGRYSVSNVILVQYNYDKPNLSFYPNPVNDKLNITGLKSGDQIQLYSADGKLLSMQKAIGPALQVNMAGYTKGVYHVIIISNSEKVFAEKIVKY